jgi:pimeloyl-ACP methyl ester carboxylesterase
MKISSVYKIALFATILLLMGCKKDPFTQSGMAEDHFFLKSGNQHMPVTVSGNVDAKKFLLIIHGGPGGNGIVYRDNYVKENVEKEFAVVYWDQRFAGNTQGNGGNSDISAFRQDIKNLLTLLKAKYGSDNDFYLFGHSWGGFLAPYFLVEGDNQAMVKGWIQIGGAHNYRMNDSLTREMLLFYGNQELAVGNNTADWEEIVDWCQNNGFEGRENAGTLNGFAHRAEQLMENVRIPEFDLDFSLIKQNAFLSQWSNGIASALRQIDNPTYTIPNSDQLNRITIPTLLLWGKYDFVCPPGLADDIEANISSADVSKIIYPNSGHSPMANQPNQFWFDVVNWVKSH